MEAVADKSVHKALAARLAHYKISDAIVSKVASRVIREGLKIGRFDFCPYGICIDYFADKKVSIDRLLLTDRYRVVRLFPYGILVDDFFHVRVEMEVPELAGQLGR